MGQSTHAVQSLNQAYIRLHPEKAQQAINTLPITEIVALITQQPPAEMLALWAGLTLEVATEVFEQLPEPATRVILQRGDAVLTARVLVRLSEAHREAALASVDGLRRRELTSLVQYREDSAGGLMDTNFLPLQESMTAREAMHQIRKYRPRFTRQLYIIDEAGVLQHMVELNQLAMADGAEAIQSLSQPLRTRVTATATREEVSELLKQHHVTDLPVVDLSNRLIGIIRYDALMDTVREESSADMLTMVGASRDEHALSGVRFVVKKRLPWLSINLITAFLAAAVVGWFEALIAQFTALAVLLPVVAGQSGNTGAQALAVTMRGLALREIGSSQWLRVVRKEVGAAAINGLAIALMTAAGVYVWSRSVGLMLVIGVSMVIAMLAAALSGVIIPIVLSSLGQDPAQSSSIILTTVTDVVGFFAFLSIATALSGML